MSIGVDEPQSVVLDLSVLSSTPPCIFVTGVPGLATVKLARGIANWLNTDLVQLARTHPSYLQDLQPCEPGSFEHHELIVRQRLIVAATIATCKKPAVIEGLPVLTTASDLLRNGHVVVVVQTPPWEKYEKYCTWCSVEGYSEDYDHLHKAFHRQLYAQFAPLVESLIDEDHHRMVVCHYRDPAERHIQKIANLLDMTIQCDGIVHDE